MLGARPIAEQKPTPYATGADFCRIFEKDMNHLYLLSFLLTGDQVMAEKCFVRGLDDSTKGNAVFKEWAQSWARRTILQNAIQMVRPRPTESSTPGSTLDRDTGHTITEPAEVAQVVELPAFERFVFVMSVLERYSDQECSLLLDCTRRDVIAARTRALRQVGRSRAFDRKSADIGSDEQALPSQPEALQLDAILHLAPSAH
jgi:DNA-directed RNA polymerase specialized sigma24 family protein